MTAHEASHCEACRTCADLKRQYGWACQDLRNAARKLVRSDGAAIFQEQVDNAKARKRELAARMNAHDLEKHQEGVA